MKMYEKPEAKVVDVSKEDIIQTSLELGSKDDVGFIEFSVTSQSDATGNVFQK